MRRQHWVHGILEVIYRGSRSYKASGTDGPEIFPTSTLLFIFSGYPGAQGGKIGPITGLNAFVIVHQHFEENVENYSSPSCPVHYETSEYTTVQHGKSDAK